VAELSIGHEESRLSGNRLWSALANFLTTHPNRKEREEMRETDDDDDTGGELQRRYTTIPSQGKLDSYFVLNGSSIMAQFRSLGILGT
jgi:hypothetical protein